MSLTPWKKLDNMSLSLIRKILMDVPPARYKMSDIKRHRWFVMNSATGKMTFQTGIFRNIDSIFSIGILKFFFLIPWKINTGGAQIVFT